MVKRIGLVVVLLFIAAAVYFVTPIWREISMMCSEEAAIWDEAIREFENADAVSPPPERAVLFVGSSTVRLWESLHDDMAPLAVIGRGFGGAKVNDVLVYADRIITPYRPSAVVVFIGSNDISSVLCNEAKTAERVAESTLELIAKIHVDLPGTPVYYLAITPAFSADEDLARAASVNALLRDLSNNDEDLFFIDANASITGEGGRVPPGLLKRDGRHLNRQGYATWSPVIRQRLLEDLGS